MPTPIGERRERIRIEQPILVSDGQGGTRITGYALLAVVWAREESLTDREAVMARQMASVLLSAWTVPYRTDLRIGARILITARVCTVTSYQDVEGRHAELRVLCSERQA